MRLSSFVLFGALLAGCASHVTPPVASAATPADTSVEVRHMYLFAPGKAPVRIVARDDGSSVPEELSSEPPNVR
jgi:hypothetical protein